MLKLLRPNPVLAVEPDRQPLGNLGPRSTLTDPSTTPYHSPPHTQREIGVAKHQPSSDSPRRLAKARLPRGPARPRRPCTRASGLNSTHRAPVCYWAFSRVILSSPRVSWAVFPSLFGSKGLYKIAFAGARGLRPAPALQGPACRALMTSRRHPQRQPPPSPPDANLASVGSVRPHWACRMASPSSPAPLASVWF